MWIEHWHQLMMEPQECILGMLLVAKCNLSWLERKCWLDKKEWIRKLVKTVSDEMNLTFHGSWGAYPSPEKSFFSLPSAFHSSSSHCNFTRLTVNHACCLSTSIPSNTSWHWKLWTHLPISSGSNSDWMCPIIWSLTGHVLGVPIRRLGPFSWY